MGIDQVGSRCGLVTYSSTVLTVFGLTSYQRREEVIEAVSRVTLMEGSGRTDLALRRMMLMLKESRVGSSQVAVVFFHGQSSNMAATRELAEVARKKGIVVLAVGIGSGVDERELGYIAGKKEFEFKVESHDRLNDLLVRLTTKTMNVVRHFEASEPSSIIGPGIDEGTPADVLFVLGHSATTTSTEFALGLKFVKEIVGQFKISKSETRVGVLTYGEDPTLQFGFNRYSTVFQVQSAVTRIIQRNGGSCTGKALNYVREYVFGNSHKRIGVKKVVVLITDSQSSDFEFTRKEATWLKNVGVTVFAIGVGEKIATVELTSIACSPEYEYAVSVNEYSSLEVTAKRMIVSKITQGSVVEFVCRRINTADVVFSLPSNIDHQDRKHSLRFLEAVVGHLDVYFGPVHFALVPYQCDCDTFHGFGLADEWGHKQISDFVDNLIRSPEPDAVEQAMRAIRKEGFCMHNDAEIAKIALVVLDRRSVRVTKAAMAEAHRLKQKGIRVFPIVVGGTGNRVDDLSYLASCFNCATNVFNYEQLLDVAEEIASYLVRDLCVDFAN